MDSLRETIDILKERLSDRIGLLGLKEARIGVFFTGVLLDNGNAGVAFTPVAEMPEAVCCPRTAARMPKAGELCRMSIEELLEDALGPNVLKGALSVSVINALCAELLFCSQNGYEIVEDADAFSFLPLNNRKRVALVGAFTPYIRMLKAAGNPLRIIEKNPGTLRPDEMPYYTPPEEAEGVLPSCEVVIITGTTIINRSLDRILPLVSPDATVALVGPTASMIPDAFFKRGVDIMGGIRIHDPETMLKVIGEGGSGYHLFRTCARRITMVKRR